MKKILAITLSILMVFSMTACGKNKGDAPSNDNSSGNSNEINSQDYEAYYGKISSVAGNEIEVSLAKDQFDNGGEDAPSPDEPGGEEAGMMTSSSAAAAVNGEEQGGAEERVEMEFTGETKSFTIPAGAEIFQGAGQGGQLSSLKKGSIVIVYVNKESGVVGNVTIMG